jgi:hypothetical protein
MFYELYKRAIKVYLNGGLFLLLRKLLRRLLLPMSLFMSPALFAKLEIFLILGYWPNIHNPKSLNEKICYRKLFAPPALSAVVCDKWAVREYVVSKTGRSDILSKVFFVGNDPGEIPFFDLPEKFVIKATHGSGWNIIVTDKSKVNQDEIITRCRMWLAMKYSDVSRNEKYYDKIIPRIIVEMFIEDSVFDLPLDYKCLCFDGKVRCIETVVRTIYDYREIHYDENWNDMNFRWGTLRAEGFLKPLLLQEIIEVAEQISSDFDFCRVDLYSPDNKKIIFGEITLAPGSGLSPFYPREWDYRLGELWKIKTI